MFYGKLFARWQRDACFQSVVLMGDSHAITLVIGDFEHVAVVGGLLEKALGVCSFPRVTKVPSPYLVRSSTLGRRPSRPHHPRQARLPVHSLAASAGASLPPVQFHVPRRPSEAPVQMTTRNQTLCPRGFFVQNEPFNLHTVVVRLPFVAGWNPKRREEHFRIIGGFESAGCYFWSAEGLLACSKPGPTDGLTSKLLEEGL